MDVLRLVGMSAASAKRRAGDSRPGHDGDEGNADDEGIFEAECHEESSDYAATDNGNPHL